MEPLTNFKAVLEKARAIQSAIISIAHTGPAPEGSVSRTDPVLAKSLTQGTRKYIERVTEQINGAFENGLYDACAVMIRRLVETLIIEVYEHHQISSRIKDPNGDFYHLSTLIAMATNEPAWNFSRNTKQGLLRLKDLGDKSAHSRRFTAHRSDIERIMSDLRMTVQELLSLAELK